MKGKIDSSDVDPFLSFKPSLKCPLNNSCPLTQSNLSFRQIYSTFLLLLHIFFLSSFSKIIATVLMLNPVYMDWTGNVNEWLQPPGTQAFCILLTT